MYQKILIANRGEIAVRIIRACREMGIASVAVCSEADREALHAQLADECICIGPGRPADSYLNAEQILSAAVATGAQAIYPGFGFLSESSRFARMCRECGIDFIGPPPESIERMGDKAQARRTMTEAGVPVIPGTREAMTEAAAGKKFADTVGYPVIIKAAAGGGGRGMRVVPGPESFGELFRVAQQETEKAFGDDRAVIGGLARLEGKYLMVIGQQKGRSLAENKHRNFGMPSPEGFAAILWKDGKRVREAAQVMKITARDLLERRIIEKIIPEEEPADRENMEGLAAALKEEILVFLREYEKKTPQELAEERYRRFRRM